MKRHSTIISLVLVVMAFAACQKDDNGFITLNVKLDNYVNSGNTKMYVDVNNYTKWNNNDKVDINGNLCTVKLEGGNNAKIINVAESGAGYYAIYPASIVTAAATHTVNLPAEQVYTVVGEKQVISAPIAAFANNTDKTLVFSNLCALIKVDVTPNTDIVMAGIVVTSSTANLCGSGTIDFSGATPTLSTLSGSKTVALTFDGTTTVSSGSTKSFYIYVPQFSSSITIDVRAYNGTDKYQWKKTKYGASLSANNFATVSAVPNSTNIDYFGAGTSENPYLIYYFNELNAIPNSSSSYFELMNDITCEGNWAPIGTFKGNFDGNGKAITYNITYEDASQTNLGLFGNTNGATIKNLIVHGSITANNYAGYSAFGTGSIVGYSVGSTIQNCYSNVTITSTNSSSTTNINYGGIVGNLNSGSVSYCSASGSINGANHKRVGGVIGTVATGASVTECTFIGDNLVSGNSNVGMVAGNINNIPDVTYCYYYTTSAITGAGSNADATGRLTKYTIDQLRTYANSDALTGYNVYKNGILSSLSVLP